MTRALLIPADSNQPLSITQASGLADLQRLVDGQIASAPTDREHLTLWINDEGKILGLARNERADTWWKANIYATFAGDYIAGDAVLVGFDPTSGDDVDVPDDVVAALAPDLLETSAAGTSSTH